MVGYLGGTLELAEDFAAIAAGGGALTGAGAGLGATVASLVVVGGVTITGAAALVNVFTGGGFDTVGGSGGVLLLLLLLLLLIGGNIVLGPSGVATMEELEEKGPGSGGLPVLGVTTGEDSGEMLFMLGGVLKLRLVLAVVVLTVRFTVNPQFVQKLRF